jgi:hypothetical protein
MKVFNLTSGQICSVIHSDSHIILTVLKSLLVTNHEKIIDVVFGIVGAIEFTAAEC